MICGLVELTPESLYDLAVALEGVIGAGRTCEVFNAEMDLANFFCKTYNIDLQATKNLEAWDMIRTYAMEYRRAGFISGARAATVLLSYEEEDDG